MNEGCDKQFTENLVKWANAIRKLSMMVVWMRSSPPVAWFTLFRQTLSSDRIGLLTCINRFDEDTKMSFLDLYTKVDAGEDGLENEDLLDSISEVHYTEG